MWVFSVEEDKMKWTKQIRAHSLKLDYLLLGSYRNKINVHYKNKTFTIIKLLMILLMLVIIVNPPPKICGGMSSDTLFLSNSGIFSVVVVRIFFFCLNTNNYLAVLLMNRRSVRIDVYSTLCYENIVNYEKNL